MYNIKCAYRLKVKMHSILDQKQNRISYQTNDWKRNFQNGRGNRKSNNINDYVNMDVTKFRSKT